jgi:hypothetical protein
MVVIAGIYCYIQVVFLLQFYMSKTLSLSISLLFAAVLCSSCAAKISGQLGQAGAGNFSINMSLKPRLSGLIKSFQNLAEERTALVIDGQRIGSSLAGAPGIASASLKNTSPQALDGTVRISKINDFLSTGAATGFIRFEQGAGAQGGRCTISITREMGPNMLSLVSPEIAEYLEALMAPIATGEELSNSEYLEAVASIYGAGISDEIAQSSIQASIDFPGSIQSVKNGKYSGRRAEFDIPVLDLLVLEKPLSYEVVWR